jgi:hypothetical protein
MKKIFYSPIFPPVLILLVLLSFPVMAAYKAHRNGVDSALFVQAYPQAKDGKLDNCFLCHTGGDVDGRYLNECDHCHTVYGYKAPHPEGGLKKTLNPFGLAYLEAGRSVGAFAAIAGMDSDGDGFSNEEEIKTGHNPGDKNDSPTVQAAPAVVYNREMLGRLPRTTQYMVFDTAKFGDYYALYTGVKIWDLLMDAGILGTATDITVYSVSGYSRNYALKDLKKEYSQGVFYSHYPWMKYPALTPYRDGAQIPGKLSYLLAYERDGYPLLEGKMKDEGNGRFHMYGEGPYRFIAPLLQPIVPDRSAWGIDRDDPPYPFNPGRPVGKNADYCVKSIVAIQVNTADNKSFQYNWSEKQFDMVAAGELVVYGAIRPR